MKRSIALVGTIMAGLVSAALAQSSPPLPAMPSTGGIGSVAREPVPLTADEKVAIARAVKGSGRKVKVPDGVEPQVGAELPASIELYMLPDMALAEIPAAKPYKYTMVRDRVVLVDPTTMRVVDVIAE